MEGHSQSFLCDNECQMVFLGKQSEAPFDTQAFWPLLASHQTMSSSRGTERTCLRPHSRLVAKLLPDLQ